MFLEGLWVNHKSCMTNLAVVGCREGSNPDQRRLLIALVTSEPVVDTSSVGTWSLAQNTVPRGTGS